MLDSLDKLSIASGKTSESAKLGIANSVQTIKSRCRTSSSPQNAYSGRALVKGDTCIGNCEGGE